jgi:hypothetical protein
VGLLSRWHSPHPAIHAACPRSRHVARAPLGRRHRSSADSPQALQIVLPSLSRRQSGVVHVPQFAHDTGAAGPIGAGPGISSSDVFAGGGDGAGVGAAAAGTGRGAGAGMGAGGLSCMNAPGMRPMAVSGVWRSCGRESMTSGIIDYGAMLGERRRRYRERADREIRSKGRLIARAPRRAFDDLAHA